MTPALFTASNPVIATPLVGAVTSFKITLQSANLIKPNDFIKITFTNLIFHTDDTISCQVTKTLVTISQPCTSSINNDYVSEIII